MGAKTSVFFTLELLCSYTCTSNRFFVSSDVFSVDVKFDDKFFKIKEIKNEK